MFEKVLLKHDLYRPGTNFRAWLFEVARNQALTALRSRQRLPRPISSVQPAEAPDMLESLPARSGNVEMEEEEFMTAFQEAVGAENVRLVQVGHDTGHHYFKISEYR